MLEGKELIVEVYGYVKINIMNTRATLSRDFAVWQLRGRIPPCVLTAAWLCSTFAHMGDSAMRLLYKVAHVFPAYFNKHYTVYINQHNFKGAWRTDLLDLNHQDIGGNKTDPKTTPCLTTTMHHDSKQRLRMVDVSLPESRVRARKKASQSSYPPSLSQVFNQLLCYTS